MNTLKDIYKRIGSRKRLSDTIFLTLKEAIISALVLPNQKIDEKALALELEVSSYSIHEAMMKLQYENYFTSDNKKYYTVNEVNMSDVSMLFEYLQFLSIAAVETLAIDYDIFCIMINHCLDKKMGTAEESQDIEFHMTLALSSNNHIIIKETADTLDRIRWAGNVLDFKIFSDAIEADHRRIANYISSNRNYNLEILKTMLMDHIKLHYKVYLEA